jgi:hypothetical protein
MKIKPTLKPHTIVEPLAVAFALYEKAIIDGYTFDTENPPQVLITGYAIISLVPNAS